MCTEIIAGGYYAGDRMQEIGNIPTSQDCMNKCYQDERCFAWSFLPNLKLCYPQFSVREQVKDANYMSGSCIDVKLKVPVCTEIKSGGYYAGDRQQVTGSVSTPQDCMTKCDQNNNCIAWTHLSSAQICWHQTLVTAWVNDVSYTGGSCL
ncbi:unnamed protein product, partial [Rotaria sp. Silwood1]